MTGFSATRNTHPNGNKTNRHMSQAHCQLFRAFYFDNITPLMQASVSGNVDLMDIQKLTHACRAHGTTRMERKKDREEKR